MPQFHSTTVDLASYDPNMRSERQYLKLVHNLLHGSLDPLKQFSHLGSQVPGWHWADDWDALPPNFYDRLTQLTPGSKIKFKLVELKEAENLYKLYELETKNILNNLK